MFYGLDELKKLKEEKDPNFNYKNPNIFISLPMSGREELEIKSRMNDIFNKFINSMKLDAEWNLIDNYTKILPVGFHPDSMSIYCLGDSIKMMSWADMVIFAKDYSEARGCCVEFDICRAYPELNYTFEDFLEGRI